ncbi:oxidoreductase [Mucilaginibacter sp. HMF5004]|uniref:YCF48-related protein n=1 Tax=Mucilaginibacter rivuli TaxID=2857527 RepID=UPI001C5E8DC2|nr:YCF48-related protein [Mucilaginibacter rivuli]MBW4890706.1 oxidoreductase [Mucilaginibacter rivuli]
MIKKLLTAISLAGLFLLYVNSAAAQKVTVLQQSKPVSIRGLSVVNDKIAWVSSSKGSFAVTKDAGKTWSWQQVKGFETSDFRDVEAFSDKEAVMMSSGTPALILKTLDGGSTWQVKYHNRDTSVFLDAMDFLGKYGCVMGDPLGNHFVLFETTDKGKNWKERDILKSPAGIPGEACFAASGTCLHVFDNGLIKSNSLLMVSGGSVANLYMAPISAKKWVMQPLPISQGRPSAGAFSIATNGKHWVAVGGDYQRDSRTDSTACYSFDAGKTWKIAKAGPGFQSCVQHIEGKIYLSTGTAGTYLSKDEGITWTKIDAGSYNVCIKTQHGKLTLLAGNGGKIATFSLK